MGRGLSDLQRFILTEAAKRSRLYYADVLRHFYGFPLKREFYDDGRPREPRDLAYEPSTWEDGGTLMRPGRHYFSPKEIGEATYRNAMAALSRSCKRLADRGLVEWIAAGYSRWSGVIITDKGREWLSVNTDATLPQC
jgi:hypothetical protein